jgi:AraC family transcriptional regulator
LTVRHLGPYPGIGAAFARLEAAAAEAGLLEPASVLIAIYLDNPRTTPAPELRSEAGFIIGPTVPAPPGLSLTSLPGGRYLYHRHEGSYAGLSAAWAHLRERGLHEHNVARREGPSYELYPNNPGNAATSDLVTDIYIPVA